MATTEPPSPSPSPPPMSACKRRPRGSGPLVCRRLTLFCLLAVGILTVSILVLSGSKVRQLERVREERHRNHHEDPTGRSDGGRRGESARDGPADATAADHATTSRDEYRRPQVLVTIPTSDVVPLDTHRFKKIRVGSKEAEVPAGGSDLEKTVTIRDDAAKADSEPSPIATSTAPVPKLSKKAEARLARVEAMKMKFPPLESIVKNKTKGKDEYNIIGDVSFLLDFAILGHAKTATSFLTKWFADHPNMAIWEEEVCTLYNYQPAVLARKLYKDFPQSNLTTHRGFKCPGHFSYQYLRYFRRYFTNTRLIVGVRHPVRWFESFYNFLVRKGHELPHPTELMGSCANHEHKGFCTDRAQFHQNLAKFGKTNLRDPAEKALLRLPAKSKDFLKTDNPIFLYEMSQIYDTNQTRLEQFKSDLQRFLRLPTPLPDASDAADKTTTSRVKKKVLNICLDEHQEVRDELVGIGMRASMWIRKYLMRLDPSEVTISNREFFERALKEWKYDPCLAAANASSSSTGPGLSQVVKTKSNKAKPK